MKTGENAPSIPASTGNMNDTIIVMSIFQDKMFNGNPRYSTLNKAANVNISKPLFK